MPIGYGYGRKGDFIQDILIEAERTKNPQLMQAIEANTGISKALGKEPGYVSHLSPLFERFKRSGYPQVETAPAPLPTAKKKRKSITDRNDEIIQLLERLKD
jgi:hypothetical protein